ncbi:proto-oncogene tyrosine-protein kinase ROS-like isoform X2 [Artemia franciscana]|uniref:proto-oncogene tyrosine-protein kinase ROS-like isoform X2 n=1 Tax=Artemia franciscana TaxID=6661 RepID=UPI0032D9B764
MAEINFVLFFAVCFASGVFSECPRDCTEVGNTTVLPEACHSRCLGSQNEGQTEALPEPRVILGAILSTSLQLTVIQLKQSVDGYFQLQYVRPEADSNWRTVENATEYNQTVWTVHNLQPYTFYQFRQVYFSSDGSPPIFSLPSTTVRTLAAGPPSSSPIVIEAKALDTQRIAINWKAPEHPNGEIINYHLRFYEMNGNPEVQVKELDGNSTFYVISHRLASANYSISVCARNKFGYGPETKVVVQMPSAEVSLFDEKSQYILFSFGASVMQQNLSNHIGPVNVVNLTSDITSMDVLESQKLLFISNSNGDLLEMELKYASPLRTLLPRELIGGRISKLSVDWLNELLYFAIATRSSNSHLNRNSEVLSYSIGRCSIAGKNLTFFHIPLFGGLVDLQVDPYNGFLFWVTDGQRGGIYRLDLADFAAPISLQKIPKRIFKDEHLGPFQIDLIRQQILVVHQENSTVFSLSFEGDDIVNFRSNVQTSSFCNVSALSFNGTLFYWAVENEIFKEEFHDGMYFHNQLDGPFSSRITSLRVMHEGSQPQPVPTQAVSDLQAIFGSDRCLITWLPSPVLPTKGIGAWKMWQYEIHIDEMKKGFPVNSIVRESTTTEFTEKLLTLNTTYRIAIRPFVQNLKTKVKHHGPMSAFFVGKTLYQPEVKLFIAGKDGVGENNFNLEHAQLLIPKESLMMTKSSFHIKQIMPLNQSLYLLGNDSRFYLWQFSKRELKTLNGASASAACYERLARKIYWSSTKSHRIFRTSIYTEIHEDLPISALASSLACDSIHGRLFWSTSYSVEGSRLNGMERKYYFRIDFLSGKLIASLTLDEKNEVLYWAVRSFSSMSLYWYDLKNEQMSSTAVGKFPFSNSLTYMDDRILWIGNSTLYIVDRNGSNLATSMFSDQDVTAISVSGAELQTNFNVLPKPVLPSSVSLQYIDGYLSSIAWSHDETNDYPNEVDISYEVKVSNGTDTFYQVVNDAILEVPNTITFKPYSICIVTIKPFTYWSEGDLVTVTLRMREAAPSMVYGCRAFYQPAPVFSESEAGNEVVLRWDPPREPNGILISYEVEQQDAITGEIVFHHVQDQTELRLKYSHGLYNSSFIIIAVNGGGKSSPHVCTLNSNPPILPLSLVAVEGSLLLLDVDAAKSHTTKYNSKDASVLVRVPVFLKPTAISYIAEERLAMWTNEHQELWAADLVSKNKTKLTQLDEECIGMAVDWISRILYWIEYNSISKTSTVRKMDLTAKDSIGHELTQFVAKINRKIDDIHVDPFSGTFVTVQYKNRKVVIITHNMSLHYQELSTEYCTVKQDICSSIMTYDNMKPELIFINCDGSLMKSCNRTMVMEETLTFILNGNLMSTDKKGSANLIQNETVYKALSIVGTQPYPNISCLSSLSINYKAVITTISSYFVELKLPLPVYSLNCKVSSLPSVIYTVHYGSVSSCNDSYLNCDTVKVHTTNTRLSNLTPNTEYVAYVVVSNFFSEKMSKRNSGYGPITVKTKPAAPSSVRNISATIASPTSIKVFWKEPEIKYGSFIKYRVSVEAAAVEERKTVTQQASNQTSFFVEDLNPSTVYKIKVESCSETFECSQPAVIHTKTHPFPGFLELVKTGSTYIQAKWVCDFTFIDSYVIQYRKGTQYTNGTLLRKVLREKTEEVFLEVNGLEPKTKYALGMLIYYKPFQTEFTFPEDETLKVQTKADIPLPPSRPSIIEDIGVLRLVWDPPKDNGAVIDRYEIQARADESSDWDTLEVVRDSKWRITSKFQEGFVFRVRARNGIGWSFPSPESEVYRGAITQQEYVAGGNNVSLIVSLTVILSLLTSVLGICFAMTYCRRQKYFSSISKAPNHTGADVELFDRNDLATLRELPRSHTQRINSLYNATDSQLFSNLEFLPPLIKRDDVVLTKFLGSGAFGEVFEGVVRFDSDSKKVAVKTLRKGATEQDKLEFIKEAELMGKFRHEHILKMLGYCFDEENIFILMELMEGDLLTFLRGSRASELRTSPLNLIDLVNMCIEVARGCCYLEELHFVHRDLAARNCLISTATSRSDTRVVKIGDFGLARDIYRNDYYRKEGEGLLPVRWMSPESLIDGIFTTQSDVWSFGVLVWEIMTFGQQPYPARNNLEVLNYVRNGGRLTKPLGCPDVLFELMESCWSFNPNDRPTFQHCLNQLLFIRMSIEDNQLHHQRSSNSRRSASKESLTTSRRADSAASTAQANSRGEVSTISNEPSSSQSAFPKYLELLDNNGYEIPIQRQYSAPRRPTCAVNPTYGHRHSLTFPYINGDHRSMQQLRGVSASFTDIAYIPCGRGRDDFSDVTGDTSIPSSPISQVFTH